MDNLDLYAVGASGRVNLGELLTGVKYVQAEKQADGTILVKPVNIRPATGKSAALPQDEPIPGTEPARSDLDDDDEPPFNA